MNSDLREAIQWVTFFSFATIFVMTALGIGIALAGIAIRWSAGICL